MLQAGMKLRQHTPGKLLVEKSTDKAKIERSSPSPGCASFKSSEGGQTARSAWLPSCPAGNHDLPERGQSVIGLVVNGDYV